MVAGTNAADLIPPQLAAMLKQLCTSREQILTQVEALVEAHLNTEVQFSIPAVEVRTEAHIITKIADKDFKTADHLVSYAGLAPVTWRSGTSIRGHHPSKKRNKNLKQALFLSAFAALKDPNSRAYNDRKGAEGKRQPGPDRSRPAPLRRPLRDAPRQHLLRGTNPEKRLNTPGCRLAGRHRQPMDPALNQGLKHLGKARPNP